MRRTLVCAAILSAILCTACGRQDETPVAAAPPAEPAPAPAPVEPIASPVIDAAPPVTASATLTPTMGNTAGGQLSFTPEDGGARLRGMLTGLAPDSVHGFHVHETGDCSAPDASSAGAHFNPDGQPHGNAAADTPHHAGDIPNVTADAHGNASVDLRVAGVGVASGDARDVVGKALVLHEKADDYATQPSGDSGARIACGVIRTP